MAKNRLTFNDAGWDELVSEVIETDGVPRMRKVADAANREIGEDGFKVSVEGDNPLSKRNYRATVITATEHAKRENAKHNTLIRNFPQAGGQ